MKVVVYLYYWLLLLCAVLKKDILSLSSQFFPIHNAQSTCRTHIERLIMITVMC